MRILQVITALNLGGAQTLLENLSYGLAVEGQDVTVVSLESQRTATARRLEERGIRVIYLDKKPHFDSSVVGKLARVFRELRPDVVHAHNIRKLYVLGAAKKAGVRHVIYTVHNIAWKEQGRLGGAFSGLVFRAGLMVPVGLSPLVTQSIEERYRLKNVPTIFNGTDLGRFHKKTDYRLHEPPVILNIARLDEQKNHARLIDAFELVLGSFPGAVLVIVGDGVLMEDLKSMTRERGLEQKVCFDGLRDDVAPYFDRADLFCLSSDYEGMPMTLIEAMAAGMPIVSTGVGGIPDMLRHGSSALLTPPDAPALAEAMLRLLSDTELRRSLGRAAWEESRRFSHRATAENYLALYREVSEQG